MKFIFKKISLVKLMEPKQNNINERLQWLGSSLGLFSLRDKNSSCFRIFIEVLKASQKNKALTSDQISHKTGLSRGTVVFHLNKLIKAGIIISEKNKYILRAKSLHKLMEELHKDVDEIFKKLEETGDFIDRFL